MTEIKLIYRRKDFEELYSLDNQLHYFKSPQAKKAFQNLLISISAFGIVLLLVLNGSLLHIILFGLGLLLVYAIIWYTVKAREIWRKRRRLKRYLKGLDTIEKYRLILSEEGFSFWQDEEEFEESWNDFLSYQFHDSFIFLQSKKEDYLFPQKSMTQVEFEQLKTVIVEKVKENL